MFDFAQAAKEVKLVCLDMDGTLLGSDREIPAAHKKIPAYLRSKGVRFTLITGRPPYMCVKEVSELGVKEPLVCSNGALLCAPDGRLLRPGTLLDYARVKPLIDFMRAEGMAFYLYTPERIYTCPDEFPHASRWRKRLREEIRPEHRWEVLTFDRFDPRRERILKFLVCTERQDAFEAFVDAHPEVGVNHARTTPDSIDACAAGADKGAGLKALLGLMGVAPEQAMVFGDGGNDVPMFSVAKYAVAMKNAADFVKPKAKATTDLTNDEGGAFFFLQKVFGEA